MTVKAPLKIEALLLLDLFCTSSLYKLLEGLCRGDRPGEAELPKNSFFLEPDFMDLFTGQDHVNCSGEFMNSIDIVRFDENDYDNDRLQIRVTIRTVVRGRRLLALFLSWLLPHMVVYEGLRSIGYYRDIHDAWPTLIHQDTDKDSAGDLRPRITFHTTYKTGRAISYGLNEITPQSVCDSASRNFNSRNRVLIFPGGYMGSVSGGSFDCGDKKEG